MQNFKFKLVRVFLVKKKKKKEEKVQGHPHLHSEFSYPKLLRILFQNK